MKVLSFELVRILLIAGMVLFVGSKATASVNQSGYLQMTGTTPSISPYIASSSTRRFIWDPLKMHFQAGDYLPAQTSAGGLSFSYGRGNLSSGTYSVAFGYNNTASGTGSFAIGQGNDASGLYSAALLRNSSADGNYSLAAGYYSTASSSYSIALGRSAWASTGDGAVSLGYYTSANGRGVFAAGSDNSANGYGSVAMGRLSEVIIPSGYQGTTGAYAIGYGLMVRDPYAFVIGKFNALTSGTSQDYAFVVGNGTGDAYRSDAFTIDDEGNVWAAGTITAAGDSSFSGDLNFNGNALVSAASGLENIDHIWHNDGAVGGADGTWNFVSDGTNKENGNARLQAGHIWMTGSGQNNYIAGNLGIGTNPSQKLDVNGSALIRGALSTHGRVTVGGSDLILGTNDGRDQGPSKPLQRALVHTGPDQLIVNFNGDFEGGVVLTGKVTLTEAQGGISMGNFQ